MPTVHKFKLLASVVQAVRVGANGLVELDGKTLVASPGSWVVFDHHGGRSNWADDEFRLAFEPVDDDARDYLERNRW